MRNFSEINTLNEDNQIKVDLSSHSPFVFVAHDTRTNGERNEGIITRLLGNFLSISELIRSDMCAFPMVSPFNFTTYIYLLR